LHKTSLKLLGIDEGEDPPKRIVRRDAIGQIKQLRKKRFFGFAKFLDLHPSIGSTQHSTNRQNDNIPSSVQRGFVPFVDLPPEQKCFRDLVGRFLPSRCLLPFEAYFITSSLQFFSGWAYLDAIALYG
jgi:hypothetical protein